MEGKHILNQNEYLRSTVSKTNSLFEGIVQDEVIRALSDWKMNNNSNCVLIGGLALSHYVEPRPTTDVDVLFLTKDDIPTFVNGFKRNRGSAFLHLVTHVEVELITAALISTDQHIIDMVFQTANVTDGIKIASPSGLIALKLGRFSNTDIDDIKKLMDNYDIHLIPFDLSAELMDKLNTI